MIAKVIENSEIWRIAKKSLSSPIPYKLMILITMKVIGIILLVFAALNLIVTLIAAANGAADAAGQKVSNTLLLGAVGGGLYYYGCKKSLKKWFPLILLCYIHPAIIIAKVIDYGYSLVAK